nr:3'-5' exoribonuclease 1-like [Ipomoea batatas]
MRCNMKEAMQIVGLAWQGRAHCGLDDAKHTVRLLALLMHKAKACFGSRDQSKEASSLVVGIGQLHWALLAISSNGILLNPIGERKTCEVQKRVWFRDLFCLLMK